MSKIRGLNILLLFLVVINEKSYINTSTTCELGYYYTNEACAPCPAGK